MFSVGQKDAGTFDYIKEMKTSKDFEDAVSSETRLTVMQCGASWCGPCKVMKPKLIEAVKNYNGAVDFLYVDID